MNYAEAIAWLERDLHFGPEIKPGLERIKALCAALGHPERSAKSILVAGTNGKGSTTAYLAALLEAAGYRVGAYFSPHLISYTERFRLDGREVDEQELAEALSAVADCVPDLPEPPSPFEALTGAAFYLFQKRKCDWQVLEIGLGGRGDATNVVTPEVSVITHLALDHTIRLGSTLEAIASEKSGVIHQGKPVVVGSSPQVALRVLLDSAAALAAPVHIFGRDFRAIPLEITPKGTRFNYVSGAFQADLVSPLVGLHQAHNAALALEAFRLVEEATNETLQQGLKRTCLPGRFEVRQGRSGLWIFDVAHNPDAVSAFVQTFRRVFPGRRATVIFGAMKDKDYAGMLAALRPVTEHLLLGVPGLPRAADCTLLQNAALAAGFQAPLQCNALPAVARAAAQAELVAVLGSHYVVGEVLAAGVPF